MNSFYPDSPPPTPPESYPDRLILDIADLLEDFRLAIGGEYLPKEDLAEIIAQVVCKLMNAEDPRSIELTDLPDFNRIVSKEVFSSVPAAIPDLAEALRKRMRDIGALSTPSFNYYFDHMVGHDVVLSYIPY